MKIARAQTKDINALADLASAVTAMQAGNIPPTGEADEWEYIGTKLAEILHSTIEPAQREEAIDILQRCMRHLFAIDEGGELLQAAMNLETIFLPENKIIDLEADTLEAHPEIKAALKDKARLDLLENQNCTIGKIAQKHYIFCSGNLVLGDGATVREALDEAMETIAKSMETGK